MAKQSSDYLKARYQRRDKPQESDYVDLIDSYKHKTETEHKGLFAELSAEPYSDIDKHVGHNFKAQDEGADGGYYHCYETGWEKTANTSALEVDLSGITSQLSQKASNERVDGIEDDVDTLKAFKDANGIVLQDNKIPAQYIPVKGTKTVANQAARNAYILTITPSADRDGVPVLVLDDGDGKWAEYRYILGTTSWLKTADEDNQGALNLDWSGLTNVPTTFPPASHTQAKSTIVGLEADLATIGTNISTAQTTATNAATAAATAQTTANTAVTNAATAQTTANTAATNASSALSAATSANTAAGNALTTAEEAVDTAEAALAEAESKQADLGIVLVDGKIPVDKLPSSSAVTGSPFDSELNVVTDTYPLPPSPAEDDRVVYFFGAKTPPARAKAKHFVFLQHVVVSITNLQATSFTISFPSVTPSDGYKADVVRVVSDVETTHADWANKTIPAGSGTITQNITGVTASSIYRVRVRNTSGTRVSQNYEIEFSTPAVSLTKFAKIAALNLDYYFNFGSALVSGKMPSTPAAAHKAMTLVGGVTTGQTSLDSTQSGNTSIKLDGTTGYLTLAFANSSNVPVSVTLAQEFVLGIMCKFANTAGARIAIGLSSTSTITPVAFIRSGVNLTANGALFCRNAAGVEWYDTADEVSTAMNGFVDLQTQEAWLVGLAGAGDTTDLYLVKNGVSTFLKNITRGSNIYTNITVGASVRTGAPSDFANIFAGYGVFHNGVHGVSIAEVQDIHNTGTRA